MTESNRLTKQGARKQSKQNRKQKADFIGVKHFCNRDYLYDNGQTDEGRAYVYLGSASGLATSAAWTAESDQADALFGYSVASAGDVNGDGYSDVVVGAYGYDNGQNEEGRAYLYLGSTSGLAPIAVWTAESDQAYA